LIFLEGVPTTLSEGFSGIATGCCFCFGCLSSFLLIASLSSSGLFLLRFFSTGFAGGAGSVGIIGGGEFGGVLIGEISADPGCIGDLGSEGGLSRLITGVEGIVVDIGGGRPLRGDPCICGIC
jgi:hypothetical protein